MTTSNITRSQFADACKALLERLRDDGDRLAQRHLQGWTWVEHPTIAGLGYLSRTAFLSRRPGDEGDVSQVLEVEEEDMVEEADDAATIPHRSDGITSRQYIVYSPTFQVPVLYFTVHDSHGTPLCLGDLIQTSLFKPDSLPPSEITSFGLSPESSPFPMLSQGDHPTLGTPCWYLHPCETPKAVGEIMAEIQRPEWTQAEYLTQWLRTWFAVLSGVVDLRP